MKQNPMTTRCRWRQERTKYATPEMMTIPEDQPWYTIATGTNLETTAEKKDAVEGRQEGEGEGRGQELESSVLRAIYGASESVRRSQCLLVFMLIISSRWGLFHGS